MNIGDKDRQLTSEIAKEVLTKKWDKNDYWRSSLQNFYETGRASGSFIDTLFEFGIKFADSYASHPAQPEPQEGGKPQDYLDRFFPSWRTLNQTHHSVLIQCMNAYRNSGINAQPGKPEFEGGNVEWLKRELENAQSREDYYYQMWKTLEREDYNAPSGQPEGQKTEQQLRESLSEILDSCQEQDWLYSEEIGEEEQVDVFNIPRAIEEILKLFKV